MYSLSELSDHHKLWNNSRSLKPDEIKVSYKTKLTLVSWGIFGVLRDASSYYALYHLASVFSSPYRDYFAIFRSRDSTANPRTRRTWTVISTTGKFITCSYLLMYVLRKLFAKYYYSITYPWWKITKSILWIIWLSGDPHGWWYHTMAGRWSHGKKNRSLEGSICMGKYYLGLNNQCRQSSCAVYYALTIRLGMGRWNHLWSSSVHMSTGSQCRTL